MAKQLRQTRGEFATNHPGRGETTRVRPQFDMASQPKSEQDAERTPLERMLAEHERQLDEVLEHVIGVLVAARAAREAQAARPDRGPDADTREE
jgi:hypothetical protein